MKLEWMTIRFVEFEEGGWTRSAETWLYRHVDDDIMLAGCRVAWSEGLPRESWEML